jgi:hypothetical protein
MENTITIHISDAAGHRFDPPIKVEYYPEEKELSIFVDEVDTIDLKYGLDNFMTGNLTTTEEKLRRMVEFDLAHAFGHPPIDPNFEVFHWALFGNLKCYYKGENEDNYDTGDDEPAVMHKENQYDFIDRVLPKTLELLGIDNRHCAGLSSAHGDKFYSLRSDYEAAGYHFNFGALVGILSCINPYSKESRDTENGWKCPNKWNIENLKRFENAILLADKSTKDNCTKLPEQLKL